MPSGIPNQSKGPSRAAAQVDLHKLQDTPSTHLVIGGRPTPDVGGLEGLEGVDT